MSETPRSFPRKQFCARDDVLLLIEATYIEPWTGDVMDKWKSIATSLRNNKEFGVDKDGKACHARFMLLVKHWRAQNILALRKSGEEDYKEKERLLDNVVSKMDDHNGEKLAEKNEKWGPLKLWTMPDN
jgi:hypothetical protein